MQVLGEFVEGVQGTVENLHGVCCASWPKRLKGVADRLVDCNRPAGKCCMCSRAIAQYGSDVPSLIFNEAVLLIIGENGGAEAAKHRKAVPRAPSADRKSVV